MSKDESKIAALNDAFRSGSGSGRLYITTGLVGRSDLDEILAKVKSFKDFTDGNDPYGEHDFGSFEQSGALIFWKVDYYDLNLRNGSPDPGNPAVTTRVLTVMLAEEY